MKFIHLALPFALLACSPPAPGKTDAAPPEGAEKAAAGSLVDGLFTDGVCYLATFDAPAADQTIVTFLVVDPGTDVRALDTAERKQVGFAFQIKDDADIYTGYGACTREPETASCFIEGDGGEFNLIPAANGGLRIAITRMEVEGPERFAPNLADSPGNRTFDLARGSGTDCMID